MLRKHRLDGVKPALRMLKYYPLFPRALNARRICRADLRMSSFKALDPFIVDFLDFNLERLAA
jgi:hypothetical protein